MTKNQIKYYILINLLSFIALSLIIFEKNSEYLFYGFDGHYTLMLIEKQMQSGWKTLGLGINFLQSLGNVSYATNFWLVPSIWVAYLVDSIKLNQTILYLFFSLELFISALIISRWIGLGWLASLASAWLLPLLTMPYHGFPIFYHVFSLTPHLADLIALSGILLIIYFEIKLNKFYRIALFYIIFIIGIVYIILAYTSAVILIAPVSVLLSFFYIIQYKPFKENIGRFIISIILFLIIYLSGLFDYLNGLLGYTAANFYSSELIMDRDPWVFTSILFHKNLSSVIALLGIMGAFLNAMAGSFHNQILARSFILTILFLLIFSWFQNIFLKEAVVSVLYFEFILWPFYVVYSILFISKFFCYFNKTIIIQKILQFKKIAIILCPWLLIAIPTAIKPTEFTPLFPVKTPIMEILSKEIEFNAGKNFNGRVVTFTGLTLPGNADWAKLGYMDYQLRNQFGTEHRSLSLWALDIPTLWEYNAYLTPMFFRFTHHFFSKPDDIQTRNVMVWRNINLKILKLIGVKFVITDGVTKDMKLRATMSMGSLGTHYLYEVTGPNLGQYSPLKWIKSNKLSDAINIISKDEFNPLESVVTSTDLPSNLTQAKQVLITMNMHHIDITAKSESNSILILPFEFSNCLKLMDVNTGQEIKLFRVNAILTGLIFNKNLDASLKFNLNPFESVNCRQLDVKDFRDMLGN